MSHPFLPEQVSHDLIMAVIDDEEISLYPWDLTEADTEEYLEASEKVLSLLDCLEPEELADRADTFFSNLQQCWDRVESPTSRASLLNKFMSLLPADYLTQLIEGAETLVGRQIEALEQLVACVRPLFPHWLEEDLQVFARPYAYVMRDGEEKAEIEPKDWETLSEIDRVRLSMAIANEVLKALSH